MRSCWCDRFILYSACGEYWLYVLKLLFPCLNNSEKLSKAISSFGTGTPFRLIEPILKACSADILERLESETPVSPEG